MHLSSNLYTLILVLRFRVNYHLYQEKVNKFYSLSSFHIVSFQREASNTRPHSLPFIPLNGHDEYTGSNSIKIFLSCSTHIIVHTKNHYSWTNVFELRHTSVHVQKFPEWIVMYVGYGRKFLMKLILVYKPWPYNGMDCSEWVRALETSCWNATRTDCIMLEPIVRVSACSYVKILYSWSQVRVLRGRFFIRGLK